MSARTRLLMFLVSKPYARVEMRRLLSLNHKTNNAPGETSVLLRSALCPCIDGELLRSAKILQRIRLQHKFDVKYFQNRRPEISVRNFFEKILPKNFCRSRVAVPLHSEAACRRDEDKRPLPCLVSTPIQIYILLCNLYSTRSLSSVPLKSIRQNFADVLNY